MASQGKKNYFKTKKQLFSSLSSSKTAVINYDDKYAVDIIESTNASVITYGLNNKANIYPIHVDYSIHGIQSEISIFNKK